jgi:redox-sensitive bicupin YhaK (pirin superfamily)
MKRFIVCFECAVVCGLRVRYAKGHAGRIAPGDLQWMSAARGIMHSEVPAEKVEAHGLQMWAGNVRR